MNTRRVRLRLTLLYTALSAVAVVALGVLAMRAGTERVEDGAEREAEWVLRDYSFRQASGEVDPPINNTWLVHIDGDDQWDDPRGDTWVEPPLYGVAQGALQWGTSSSRFKQDGTEFLAFGQRVNELESLVTVVDFTYFQDRATTLRIRLGLAVLGAVVAVGLAGWFVTGRSLRPIRAANARQRDFIADASHQLRTPLAVIRASASQALSRSREADAYVAALAEIDAAAESAGAAVAELLELARIDSGQFSPRLAPLRLDLLAEEVVAGIRVDGCRLSTAGDRSIVVDADYALLHHAMENVVRNAAARATEVTVTTAVDERRATVTVADNGPGFPAELLPDVFERFRRGDQRGSSGLGLAIARSIIVSHGGDAEARNRGPVDAPAGPPSSGAEVRLWLPRPKDPNR